MSLRAAAPPFARLPSKTPSPPPAPPAPAPPALDQGRPPPPETVAPRPPYARPPSHVKAISTGSGCAPSTLLRADDLRTPRSQQKHTAAPPHSTRPPPPPNPPPAARRVPPPLRSAPRRGVRALSVRAHRPRARGRPRAQREHVH